MLISQKRSLSGAVAHAGPNGSLFSPLPSSYKQSSAVLQTADAVVTTLPNGLRVATQKFSGPVATFSVHVNTGSRYEKEEDNGVAHFLEHMFFKVMQQQFE
jgi:predicted Zn-dependent peptidase